MNALQIGKLSQPVFSLIFQWAPMRAWQMRLETDKSVALTTVVNVIFCGISTSGFVHSCVAKAPGLWSVVVLGGTPGLTAPLPEQQFNASVKNAVQALAKKQEVEIALESKFLADVRAWYVPKNASLAQLLNRAVPHWHMKLNGEVCVGDVWPDSTSVKVAAPKDRAVVSQQQHSTLLALPPYTFIPLTKGIRGITYTDLRDTDPEWRVTT